MDTLTFIMAYEDGEATAEEIIDGFARLIKDGTVWSLQGSYGRMAARLIEEDYISPGGTVLSYPEGD